MRTSSEHELARAQEKLRAIDKLSNCIQKVSKKDADDIAYLIHQICEAEYIDSTLARWVQHYQLLANRNIFMSV